MAAPVEDGREHRIEWGHFGWSCSCGSGNQWPLAPEPRGRAAARAHLRAVERRIWRGKKTAEEAGRA